MMRFFLVFLMASSLAGTVIAEEQKVAGTANETAPIKVGEQVPDVSVTDAKGKSVKLRSLHEKGPVVIVFFRGSWCPICTRHFRDLIKTHPEIANLGATLVAVSPDTAENTQENMTKLKTPFPLLSDSKLTAAKAFGLAFQVDDATLTKYRGFGIDLEKASGQQHHALPVPAVYIVDRSGKIVFAHSNPDYTKRLDTGRILLELKKLQ